MPRGLGSLLAFLAVPFLVSRFGARQVLAVGVLISAYSLWEMSHFDLTMTAGPIKVTGFLQGVGTGLMFAPLSTLGYATLAPQHRTEGTIIATMARTLGSSVGISVIQALLINNSALAHARLTERIIPGDLLITDVLPSMMDPSTSIGLQMLNAEVTRQGAMVGYDNIFGWMAVAALLMLPMVLIMKSPPPQKADHEVVPD